MPPKFINKKVLMENNVFVDIIDCAECLDMTINEFAPYCLEYVSNFNTAEELVDYSKNNTVYISENNFNQIVLNHFQNKKNVLEFTRVESLAVKGKPIYSAYSLEMLLAPNAFISEAISLGCGTFDFNEYIDTIKFPLDCSAEIEKMKLKKHFADDITHYKNELNAAVASIPKKYNLEIKTITVIKEHYIDFSTFICGKGIFFETQPEYILEDHWEDSVMDDDGSIHIYSGNYRGNEKTLSAKTDWDFRKYSVFENIAHCVKNIPSKAEWTDELSFDDKGGVDFSLNIETISKMFNHASYPEMFFIDGVPDVDESFYTTDVAPAIIADAVNNIEKK